MSEVIFHRQKRSRKLHKLAAHLSMSGQLVFDEEVQTSRGSVNHRLRVRAIYKGRILRYLGIAFNGVSSTCGRTDDDRLLHTLERVANLGGWKSLGDVEKWLLDRNIPFTKQKQVTGY